MDKLLQFTMLCLFLLTVFGFGWLFIVAARDAIKEMNESKKMDALEFVRESQRMCKAYGSCKSGCPAYRITYGDETYCAFQFEVLQVHGSNEYEKIVEIVEDWSKHENKHR